MNTLIDTYKLIVDGIEIFSKSKEDAKAEDSIPILMYIFSKAGLRKIISTLK